MVISALHIFVCKFGGELVVWIDLFRTGRREKNGLSKKEGRRKLGVCLWDLGSGWNSWCLSIIHRGG